MAWVVTHFNRWLLGDILRVTASTALLGPEPWVSLFRGQSSSLSSHALCPKSPPLPSNQKVGIRNPQAGVPCLALGSQQRLTAASSSWLPHPRPPPVLGWKGQRPP